MGIAASVVWFNFGGVGSDWLYTVTTFYCFVYVFFMLFFYVLYFFLFGNYYFAFYFILYFLMLYFIFFLFIFHSSHLLIELKFMHIHTSFGERNRIQVQYPE